ncbi:unnamed protein product [Brassica oleracea]
MAAQFAAEATLRRDHAAQKDDDMPPIEAILAPLEAELKLARSEWNLNCKGDRDSRSQILIQGTRSMIISYLKTNFVPMELVVVYFWRNQPHREANAQEVYQNSLRTEAKARVVNGTGSELDQALDSLQVMKTQMMRIAYASQGHQPPEDNGPNQVYINCELMLPGRFVQ